LKPAPPGHALARTPQRLHALDQHQHPDGAKHDHIAKRHHQIDLAQFAQQREKLHPGGRSGQPARQQHRAHLEVDRPAPPMHQNA
jgi:hypothetical protein